MDIQGLVCDPCKNEGKVLKAKTFCETCKENYCEKCTKYHRKFRISRNHSLVEYLHKTKTADIRNGVIKSLFEKGGSCTTQDYLQPIETSYQIQVLETDAAKRCRLSGCCKLTIHRTGLRITEIDHPEVTYEWPYTRIRKLGSMENKIFFFESGRRCQSGEGQFVLMSHEASLIHSLVMNSITSIQMDRN